jgi:hypothetical protein
MFVMNVVPEWQFSVKAVRAVRANDYLLASLCDMVAVSISSKRTGCIPFSLIPGILAAA